MNPDLYDDEPNEAKILTASEQAQKWYQLAALCDGNKTQASLTKLYNDNADIQRYLSAAKGGDKYAKYTLGKMYYSGVLTDVNLMKSAMWFSQASSAEISLADYELGKMCYSDIGMEIDTESAGQLFQRAFTTFVKQEQKASNPNIELKLAVIYENGLTGSVDLNMARYWRGMADNNKSDYIPEVPRVRSRLLRLSLIQFRKSPKSQN
jgi:TPR repeat protein